MLMLLLGGCASTPPAPPPGRGDAAVVRVAYHMLGAPYHYGGESPHGFDCSGLVQYAYARAGIQVPRTVAAQYHHAFHVTHPRPGDLVFFRLHGRTVGHVGIYVGNGRFIHAPSSGRRVTTDSLTEPYWRRHYAGAGRYR